MMRSIRAFRSVSGACAAITALMLVGCSSPSNVVGFDAPDPGARFRAVQQSATTKDLSRVPELIVMLCSSDPAERLLASHALERLTGENFGFHHAAPVAERAAAIARWEQALTRGEIPGVPATLPTRTQPPPALPAQLTLPGA